MAEAVEGARAVLDLSSGVEGIDNMSNGVRKFLIILKYLTCELFGHSKKSELMVRMIFNWKEDLWKCPRCGNLFIKDTQEPSHAHLPTN